MHVFACNWLLTEFEVHTVSSHASGVHYEGFISHACMQFGMYSCMNGHIIIHLIILFLSTIIISMNSKFMHGQNYNGVYNNACTYDSIKLN